MHSRSNFSFAVALPIVCLSTSAFAQETTDPSMTTGPAPTSTSTPPSTATPAPTPPPPVTTTTTETATVTTESMAVTPACPYGCEEGQGYRRWKRPHPIIGLEGGLTALAEGSPVGFKNGVGSATSLGPAWGARVGLELLPWLAFEVRYSGFYNQGNTLVNQGGKVGLFTSAGTGVARFTLPLRFIEPYLFVGAGVYHTSVTGSSAATTASTFHKSTEFGMPIGIGLNVPIDWHFSIGAEITYHRLFSESFSDNEDIGGGDPVSGTIVAKVRL